MNGVWPSWVTHSSLSPVQAPMPSNTAKTGGLPWVHCLQRDRMCVSFVGSKLTMSAMILRPLMPPAALIAFT